MCYIHYISIKVGEKSLECWCLYKSCTEIITIPIAFIGCLLLGLEMRGLSFSEITCVLESNSHEVLELEVHLPGVLLRGYSGDTGEVGWYSRKEVGCRIKKHSVSKTHSTMQWPMLFLPRKHP